jgi:hypothetical protein
MIIFASMIQINNTLVSELILERRFVCDLNACKGACCVEGDAGAPLEEEELQQLEEVWESVKPYLPQEGVAAIEKEGLYTKDRDGDWVTTLVEGKECAYTVFDDKGTAKCGIEQAYLDGKTPFKKPISCHLYPIRISKVGELDALNYSHWHICEPACACGKQFDVKVFRFLKEALVRKYGVDWYTELEEVSVALDKIKK